MIYTFSQILTALGIPRPRADQWLARGHFHVKETTPGVARPWDFGDAMRLAVFAKILDAREDISADLVGKLTAPGTLHGFKDDRAILVLWSGLIETTISDRKGGKLKVDRPDIWQGEVVRSAALTNFLLRDEVKMAIIVKLHEIESELESALAKAANRQ